VIEFFSREIRQPDQELLNMLATIGSQIGQFIERKRAEEAFREMQLELAHANRVATMGQLSASIANKAKQPITAGSHIRVSCSALAKRGIHRIFARWMTRSLLLSRRGIAQARSSGEHQRSLRRRPARKDAVAINDAILEVIALTRAEAANNSVSVRTQLAEGFAACPGRSGPAATGTT